MRKIGIIGLGWLGLPLAEKLALEEYQVVGSTTQESKAEELSKEAYGVVVLNLNPHPTGKGFNSLFETDTLEEARSVIEKKVSELTDDPMRPRVLSSALISVSMAILVWWAETDDPRTPSEVLDAGFSDFEAVFS